MSQYNSAFLNQLLKEFLSHQDPSQVHSYIQELLQTRRLKQIAPQTSKMEDTSWEENTLDFDDNTVDLAEEETTQTFIPGVFGSEQQFSVEKIKQEKQLSELGELYPITQDLPYIKIGVLGKGGMGLVVRVEDPSLHRLVALKQLKSRLNQEIDAFKREAEITAKLQHPGIIPIYEYGVLDDGSPYFTMQEVRGRTLQAIIRDIHRGAQKEASESWSLRKVMGIFHDVCETVAYAHSQGILHRDLKPQNIMVGQFGEVYVVDWGIAVMMETSVFQHFSQSSVPMRTQTSGIAGTPIYMSPEQAKGDVSSFKQTSDIYSLGAILFKILTGKNIVSGDMGDIIRQKQGVFQVSLAKTIQKIEANGKLPFGQHIPTALIEICEKALSFEPRKRYQSCLEFANAIQDWLDGVERKLRALKILAQIEEIEEKQTVLERNFKKNIDDINRNLEEEIVSPENVWFHWEGNQKLSQQISKNTQKIKQLLQTSLIFDSENYDVYEKLFLLEYQLIQEAQLQRNILAQEIARSTLSLYLEILPKDIQKIWKRRLRRQEQSAQTFRRLQHRLVGRSGVIDEVLQSFKSTQLISLIGSAGMGKTHLSLYIANQWSEENQADTVFCDITSARDLDSLLMILGTHLEVPLTNHPQKSIIQALRNRDSLLLILDNCEQIIPPLKLFLQKLLKKSSNLRILLTSRSILNIPSEKVFRLSKIRQIEGIHIFMNRAKKIRGNLHLDAQKFAAIARITRRLEQVPLAIQLAAARVSTLSISEIDLRLQESFSLLRSKLRTDQPEALHSALDWSWNLLSDWGKRTLIQCAWFKNGFTLKAAEKVIEFTEDNAPEVYELIEALVDDSLLRKDRLENGEERYTMLVSIGEYAQQKLAKFQQEDLSLQALPIRHAKYYAEQGKGYLSDTQDFLRIIVEMDNFIFATKHGELADIEICIQVALQIIEQVGPWSRGLDLIETLSKQDNLPLHLQAKLTLENIRYLRMLGRISDSIKMLEALKKRSNSEDEYFQACLVWEEGHLAESQSTFKDALRFYHKAKEGFVRTGARPEALETDLDLIDIFIKLGDYQKAQENIQKLEPVIQSLSRSKLRARYYYILCIISQNAGDYETGRKYIEQAIFYNEKAHNHSLHIRLVLQRGTILTLAEKYEEAIQNHQKALGLIRKIGDKRQESKSLITLGVCYKNLKQYERAEQMYRKALVINEEIGHRRGLAILYLNLSQMLPFLGRYQEVEEALQKALQITTEIQDKRLIGLFHSNLARYYFQTGKLKLALSHYKKSADMHQEIGHRKGWAINLGNYANTLKHFKHWAEAESTYKKAIMMCLEMNIQVDGIIMKGNLGELYWEMGDFQQAKEVLIDVYAWAGKKNVKLLQAVFGATLALLYAFENRFADAYQIFREMEAYAKEDLDEYPIFLGKKAWVYQLDNQPKRAKETVKKILKRTGNIDKPMNWAVKLLLEKFWKL